MRKHRRLFAEGLENRALLAGNVTASVSGGTLTITGDAGGNGVSVQEISAGRYWVTGFNVSGGATTVNGQNGQIVSGVTNDINVDLNGGDDVFVMANRAERRADLASRLSGGTAGPITASPETPSASVDVGRTRVPGNLTINTDEGNDGVGTAAIVGSDDIKGFDYGGIANIITGDDNDRVIATFTMAFDDLLIQTGDGADSVNTSGSGAYDFLFADLGSGNDVFASSNSRGFHSQVYGGDGDDNIQVSDYRFKEEVFLNGGSGNNRISATLLEGNLLSITTGAGADSIRVQSSRSHGDFIVNSGDGNDGVALDNAHADHGGTLSVALAGGNDTLRASNSTAEDANFDGGDGDDTYIAAGGNGFGSLSNSNFEH